MSDVSRFWNKVAGQYNQQTATAGHHHAVTEQILMGRLEGQVLAVGGMWVRSGEAADSPGTPLHHVTVLDVSEEMLRPYQDQGISTLVGDARSVPLPDASVDHVIFAQVLHHITDDSAHLARANVHRCLAEAHRVLRAGGQVWLKEVVVSSVIYGPELALAPVTRAALALAGIPLVVLHSAAFLTKALSAAGFASLEVVDTSSKKDHWSDLIQPVVGLPWLQVPRVLYPVRRDLFVGTKPYP